MISTVLWFICTSCLLKTFLISFLVTSPQSTRNREQSYLRRDFKKRGKERLTQVFASAVSAVVTTIKTLKMFFFHCATNRHINSNLEGCKNSVVDAWTHTGTKYWERVQKVEGFFLEGRSYRLDLLKREGLYRFEFYCIFIDKFLENFPVRVPYLGASMVWCPAAFCCQCLKTGRTLFNISEKCLFFIFCISGFFRETKVDSIFSSHIYVTFKSLSLQKVEPFHCVLL